jgi:hypothetical protein
VLGTAPASLPSSGQAEGGRYTSEASGRVAVSFRHPVVRFPRLKEALQMAEQNFGNHTRWVAAYHGFVFPVLALNFVWAIFSWGKMGFMADGFVQILTAAALFLLAAYARLFALTVQNRVIRLEERLRYERILPEDLKARAGEFTTGQMIALRFAGDAELHGLARKVLDEKLKSGKQIKQLIQNWRPDYLRA